MRDSKWRRDLLMVLTAFSLNVVLLAALAYLVPGIFDDAIAFVGKIVSELWD